MYQIGIDLGSSYTKGVLVDTTKKEIIDWVVLRTGYDFLSVSKKIKERLAKKHDVTETVYTCGYGRDQVPGKKVVHSEITALARAVFHRYKRALNVLDIGGQDTKYIKISDTGNIDNFKMNRKCAAGTGSFLEEMSHRLEISSDDFNKLAKESNNHEIKLNSFCTVFAVSEVIGMIKKGEALPGIIIGICNSIVSRATELVPMDEELVLSGGIPEKYPVIVELFKKAFPKVSCPDKAQLMAALGCVLLHDL